MQENLIQYQISFPNPENHYCNVTLKFTSTASSHILGMPVWTPGSYLVREYSKHIDKIWLSGASNSAAMVKINKNQWKISCKKGALIEITYQLYCNEISVRTNFVDYSQAFICPAATFLYIKGLEKSPCLVRVVPNKYWKKMACALAISKFEVKADNYDLLVDAPIQVGNHDEFDFDIDGVKHTVVMVGKNNADYTKLAVDMQKILRQTIAVFGELPINNYLFIVHNTQNQGGGLEHLNSAVLMMPSQDYKDYDKYMGFISLVAHEYFHLWNVKRIRPKELGPFNYDEENYTNLLWFFEGFTAYYDELLLYRAGFIDKENYFKKITSTISQTEYRPGVQVQNLADASFDAWIKAYRPNENSFNTQISYYGKGSIVALLLDITISSNKKDSQNIDVLMKALWKMYKKQPQKGLIESDIIAASESAAGISLTTFFNELIYSTKSPNYDSFFNLVGLDFTKIADNNKPHIGLTTKKIEGKLVVSNVYFNSAFYNAGINVNDEIIALNNMRVEDLQTAIDTCIIGDKVVLMISRAGQILNLEVKLSKNPNDLLKITAQKNLTANQKTTQTIWLKKGL